MESFDVKRAVPGDDEVVVLVYSGLGSTGPAVVEPCDSVAAQDEWRSNGQERTCCGLRVSAMFRSCKRVSLPTEGFSPNRERSPSGMYAHLVLLLVIISTGSHYHPARPGPTVTIRHHANLDYQ